MVKTIFKIIVFDYCIEFVKPIDTEEVRKGEFELQVCGRVRKNITSNHRAIILELLLAERVNLEPLLLGKLDEVRIIRFYIFGV